jgi:hypothetical protein
MLIRCPEGEIIALRPDCSLLVRTSKAVISLPFPRERLALISFVLISSNFFKISYEWAEEMGRERSKAYPRGLIGRNRTEARNTLGKDKASSDRRVG